MPRVDDVLTRAIALLDRAPSVVRAVPPVIDTASELLDGLSAVLPRSGPPPSVDSSTGSTPR